MRASETVSEANPGSTASQTGVPTQVVQQVQGTQQVGHTPPPGWVGRVHEGAVRAVAVGTWPPHPIARAIYSPALIKMFTSAALLPTRAGPPGEAIMAQGLPPCPAATAGPDECAGQTGPCVTPPAHQPPCAPAGKAATPGLSPHNFPRV